MFATVALLANGAAAGFSVGFRYHTGMSYTYSRVPFRGATTDV
jgi:hypothetical protein